jgi:acid stress-induced BolA-like protein IbaG/YrbA
MGNLFIKRPRSIDSIILDELNRPLVPDVQHNIYSRLNELEQTQEELTRTIKSIEDVIKGINENIAHRNITSGNEMYQVNEKIHNICDDMRKLLKNDQIIKAQIDDLTQTTQIHGLYESRASTSGVYSTQPVLDSQMLKSETLL